MPRAPRASKPSASWSWRGAGCGARDRGDRDEGKVDDDDAVGRMLGAAGRDVLVGGNIGVPLSAQVEESTPQTVHVVEVSSFQLETTTTFRPWIALWLNFAADHLDRHPSIEAYRRCQGTHLRQPDRRRLGSRQRRRFGGDGTGQRRARGG